MDGDGLAVRVDHEHGVGRALHVADAVEVRLQLGQLLVQQDLLLLGQHGHAAVGLHGLQLLHAVHAGADGHEVGQHAAEPTGVHVGHAATVRSIGDGLLGLLLRAHEQHGAALLGQLGHERVRLVEAHEGLLEVDDVDVPAAAEDVRLHLGVPTARLMAEVAARIEQRGNADFRHDSLHSLVLCARSSPTSAAFFGWPLAGRVAHACVIRNCRSIPRRPAFASEKHRMPQRKKCRLCARRKRCGEDVRPDPARAPQSTAASAPTDSHTMVENARNSPPNAPLPSSCRLDFLPTWNDAGFASLRRCRYRDPTSPMGEYRAKPAKTSSSIGARPSPRRDQASVRRPRRRDWIVKSGSPL